MNSEFKKVLMAIHCFPQNLLGLLVVVFTGAKSSDREFEYIAEKCPRFGVSLGDFIIFGKECGSTIDYKHEYGHHIQSNNLGWLYLIVIGIPSLFCNLWDRSFHKKWTNLQRVKWYYNLPHEYSADVLGGVNRGF